MEATEGTITMENEGMKIEQTLFTYSEEEQQEHKINKTNADLIWRPEFFTVNYEMLHSGFNLLETALYGFIKYFLKNNEKFYCSSERLAEMFCVSRNTIDNALKVLKSKWLIDYTSKPKAKWWKIRFIRLLGHEFPNHKICASNISEPQNLGFAEAQNLCNIENKYIENKKESKKKEKNQTSVCELVEAYRNDERVNQAFLEEDVIEWLEYKESRKELYKKPKWFIQQLVVAKRTITQGQQKLDIQKRFSFAVNEAISEWRKWIHWYDDTEKEYLATKKDLFPNPNLNE